MTGMWPAKFVILKIEHANGGRLDWSNDWSAARRLCFPMVNQYRNYTYRRIYNDTGTG